MITAEQINEMLEAAKPSIVEGFKKEITNSITWEVKNAASRLIAAETEKWIKENIIPEIIKDLVESKEGFIKLGSTLAPAMIEVLTKSLIDSLKEKMEKSWDRNKVFEAMFK